MKTFLVIRIALCIFFFFSCNSEKCPTIVFPENYPDPFTAERIFFPFDEGYRFMWNDEKVTPQLDENLLIAYIEEKKSYIATLNLGGVGEPQEVAEFHGISYYANFQETPVLAFKIKEVGYWWGITKNGSVVFDESSKISKKPKSLYSAKGKTHLLTEDGYDITL